MNIILHFLPYGILSVILSSINRDIRNCLKIIKTINPGPPGDYQISYYQSYIKTRKTVRDQIMAECYRRTEHIEFDHANKEIYLRDFRSKS
jgi:hypothetical protein